MSQQTWRGRIVRAAPTGVLNVAKSVRLRLQRNENARKSAEEVFSEIYASGRWGGEPYNSGSGSTGGGATAYAGYVRDLIRTTGVRTAVDIGCGDFQVASQFVDALDSYLGLDVVPALMARNTARYGTTHVTFGVMDAASGVLPAADICLIRQVLQHLSNQQIANILNRCAAYPVVVVTEHWPAPAVRRRSNVDKPHGPDTRLDSGSWVDLSAAPFNCRVVEEVLSVAVERPEYHAGETISTHVWRPRPTAPASRGAADDDGRWAGRPG